MGPNFNVSVPPTFITEASNILESLNIKLVAVVVGKSVFKSLLAFLILKMLYIADFEYKIQY